MWLIIEVRAKSMIEYYEIIIGHIFYPFLYDLILKNVSKGRKEKKTNSIDKMSDIVSIWVLQYQNRNTHMTKNEMKENKNITHMQWPARKTTF